MLFRSKPIRRPDWRLPCGLALLLAGCGGGERAAQVAAGEGARKQALGAPPGESLLAMPAGTRADAVRLAQQASFGPTEALVQQIGSQGAAGWISAQMAQDVSRYTSGNGDAIHRNDTEVDFCSQPAYAGPTCWRDWYSAEPLQWDFYRNAVGQPDQLRQRVALALQQVLVVSEFEVNGTYGFRLYYNNLLAGAFGNYREVLRKVVLSPVMGEYLDHVNNDKLAPNENFGRELLQLFSVGTCVLKPNGERPGDGRCRPTYDNDMVRNYAFALTGWTYPPGGRTAWGCWPEGANCQYMGGDMVAAPALRNTDKRKLLSKVVLPAGASSAQALDAVLDSLMGHANIAPFVGRRLIQHLVRSNPSPGYVGRVSQAFTSGSFSSGGFSFGAGVKGDLAATVAAVLLDSEARAPAAAVEGGHLREPILLFTGALRAFGGFTDGAPMGWWWGQALRQDVFRPPSVFNFHQPDYPVAGTTLVGPEFAIHNANTALERLNWLTYLFDWGGSAPDPSQPGATGTAVDLVAWEPLADRADTLVDRMSTQVLGRTLPAGPRQKVIQAVAWWTQATAGDTWRLRRTHVAAWLVLASPDYQIQR